MEMRKLVAKDLFKMATILKKIGIDEFKSVIGTPEVKKALAEGDKTNQDDQVALGMEIVGNTVGLIVGNMEKAEKDIMEFIASVTEKKVKDIENLPPCEFFDTCVAILRKEEMKDFMTRVFSLLK